MLPPFPVRTPAQRRKVSSYPLFVVAALSPLTPPVSYRSIVNQVLEKCRASTSEMIKQLLIMEGKAPFTLHEPLLVEWKDKFLREYREARVPLLRGRDPLYRNLQAEELIVRDTRDQALFYMATARAYFLGLHLRFSLTSMGWKAYRIFSCIQTLHGHGCNDDRSGALAWVGLGSRPQFSPNHRSRNHRAWQPGEGEAVSARTAGDHDP